MLKRSDVIAMPIPLPYFKKENFSGSLNDIRYLIKKEDDNFVIEAWQGPYCSTATPDEEKERAQFEFSVEGLDQAVAWLDDFINRKHGEA